MKKKEKRNDFNPGELVLEPLGLEDSASLH